MIVVLRAQMTIEEQVWAYGHVMVLQLDLRNLSLVFTVTNSTRNTWKDELDAFLINDGLESCGNSTIPLQAEAEALAWAVFVAADLGVECVTIESDSKSCVDCIHGVVSDAPWRINGILSNMSTLFHLHPLWSTSWVSRVANQAAYELVGWSQKSRF